MASKPLPISNLNLPPHLREVCAILAAGLLRLRSRAAEELARDAERARDQGEVRLPSLPSQRRHANPTLRRQA